MSRLTPKEAMSMAIAEGKKGAGFVSPNPLVGCVILDRNFSLIGSGYHARLGEAHAEINALNSVKDQSTLEGAHFFVTLEPCAHDGRTPSCAKALARLPINSVTYGLRDPNPRVNGQGAEILRQAGKTVVEFAELQTELAELCEIFLVNVRCNRPFVAMKVASSLDGKIALPDGTSQWITGESARQHVQFLRGLYDAVVVGAGTFLHDNPRLNSRDPRFKDKRQRVVILDPEGHSLAKLKGSALLSVHPAEDVLVVVGKSTGAAPSGVRLLSVQVEKDGNFNADELLRSLYAEQVYSLFVEGGARTYASFWRAESVDRLYLFVAPKLLGEGLSWLPGIAVHSMQNAISLNAIQVEHFSADLLISGIPLFKMTLPTAPRQ